MANDTPTVTSRGRFGTLGILWAIYGISRLIIALVLSFFSGTATLMFGALLSRVPDAFTMMDVFHIFYILLIVWVAVGGVLCILAALALLSGHRSAASLAVVAAIVSLPDLPLGVILGVYTLILFLPSKSSRSYA